MWPRKLERELKANELIGRVCFTDCGVRIEIYIGRPNFSPFHNHISWLSLGKSSQDTLA